MASEYLKWKYRDVKPDEPVVLTKKQKVANWWHYHKWLLLGGVVLLIAAVDIGWHALGIGEITPDYQVAVVASSPLSAGTVEALEKALAALGEDASGDRRVTVRVHPYIDMADVGEEQTPQYAAAAQVQLMADMESCESYFFLCQDCETLHTNYQILAKADGSLADRAEDVCFYAWEDCPVLAELDIASGELSGLFLARRGFWQSRVCRYREQCDILWEKLTEGAES